MVKQAANYVVSITASGSTSGKHFTYSNIAASATTATISGARCGVYKFSSGAESPLWTSTNISSFGSITTVNNFTLASSQNGFTAVNATTGALTATNRGTTIGNARSSANVTGTYYIVFTHNSTYSAGGTITSTTYSTTTTCTQNGNYVTGITVTQDPYILIEQIPASGGSKTDNGDVGDVTYRFSSTRTSFEAPASTYGALTTSQAYAMTNGNGFYLTSTANGTVSAVTKGTTVTGETTSNTITKTVTYTWTPTSTYNAAGTKTAIGAKTGYATQQANALTSTDYSANTYTGSLSIGSGLHASGGTATVTYNAWHTAYDQYTSGAYNNSHTVYDPCKVTITTNGNNRFSGSGTKSTASSSNSTFTLTHTTMGTAATTDNVTLTLYNTTNSSTVGVKTASSSITNSISSYVTPGVTTAQYTEHNASSGSVGPTLKGSCYPVYTSTATGSQITNITLRVKNASMTSGNGATINTSNGVVTWGANTTTTLGSPAQARTTNTISLGLDFGATYPSYLTRNIALTAIQSADEIVSTVVSDLSANTFTATTCAAPASGGTATLTGGKATVTYVSGAKFYPTATLEGTSASTYSSKYITLSTTENTSSTTQFTATMSTWNYSHTNAGYYRVTSTYDGVTKEIRLYYVANAVTAVSATNVVSYTQIAASGGTSTPPINSSFYWLYASGGSRRFNLGTNSGLLSETWGTMTTSITYTMTAGNGFSMTNTSNGTVSAVTKGTTVTGVTSSNTVTSVINYNWTWASNRQYMNSATTNSASATATTKATQAANAITKTVYGTPTISSPSAGASIGSIAAAGGTKAPTRTASQTVDYTYTSNATSSSTNNSFT